MRRLSNKHYKNNYNNKYNDHEDEDNDIINDDDDDLDYLDDDCYVNYDNDNYDLSNDNYSHYSSYNNNNNNNGKFEELILFKAHKQPHDISEVPKMRSDIPMHQNQFQLYILHMETQNFYQSLKWNNNNGNCVDSNHFLQSRATEVHLKTKSSNDANKKDMIFFSGKGKHPKENIIKNVYAYVSYDHNNYGPTIYLEAREGFHGFTYPMNFRTLEVVNPSSNYLNIPKKNYFVFDKKEEDNSQTQFITWLQNFLLYHYNLARHNNTKSIYPNPNTIISYQNVTNSPLYSKSSYYYTPDVEEGGPNRHVIKLTLSSKKIMLSLAKLFNSDLWLDYVYAGYVPTIRTFEGQIPFDLQWRAEMNINFGKLHIVDTDKMIQMTPMMIKSTFNLLEYENDSLFYIIPHDSIRCISSDEETNITKYPYLLPSNYTDCSLYTELKYILPKKIFFDLEVNTRYNHLMSCYMFPVAKWTPEKLLENYSGIIGNDIPSLSYSVKNGGGNSFYNLREKIINLAVKSNVVIKIIDNLINKDIVKLNQFERKVIIDKMKEEKGLELNVDNLAIKIYRKILDSLISKENETDEITVISGVVRISVNEKQLWSDGGGIIFTWNKSQKEIDNMVNNVRTIPDFKNITIKSFSSELLMIDAFLDWLYKEKPDFIGGHNIRGFDLSYIYDRYDVLKGRKTNLFSIIKNSSEMNYVSQFQRGSALKSKRTYSIKGGPQVLDSLSDCLLHETFGHGNNMPWNLSAVSTFFLTYPESSIPMRKLEIHVQNGKSMWISGGDDLSHFLAYCFWDALLSCMLIERWAVMSNMFYIAMTTGIQPGIVYFRGVQNLHFVFNYKLIYDEKLLKKFIYPDHSLNPRELHQADLWYDHYDYDSYNNNNNNNNDDDNNNDNKKTIPKDVRYLYEHDPFMKRRWEMGEIRRIENLQIPGIVQKMIISSKDAKKIQSDVEKGIKVLSSSIIKKQDAPSSNLIGSTVKKPVTVTTTTTTTSPTPLPTPLGYKSGTTNVYLPDVKDINYIKYNYETNKSKRKKTFNYLKFNEDGETLDLVKSNILNREKPFMGGYCFPVLRYVNHLFVGIIGDYVSMYPSIGFSVCMCTTTMVTEKIMRIFKIKKFEVVKVTMGPADKIQIGNTEKCALQNNLQQLYSRVSKEPIETAYIYFMQITDLERTLYPRSIDLLFASRKKAKKLMAMNSKISKEVSTLIDKIKTLSLSLSSSSSLKDEILFLISDVIKDNEEVKLEIQQKLLENSFNVDESGLRIIIDSFILYLTLKRNDHNAKVILYNTEQNSKKICLNSSFGVQCKLIGGSITAFGRFTIRTCYYYLIQFDLLTPLLKNTNGLFDIYIQKLKDLKDEFDYIMKTIYENDLYLKRYMNFDHYHKIINSQKDELWQGKNNLNLKDFMFKFISEIRTIYNKEGKTYSVFKSHGDTDSVIFFFPLLFLSPFFQTYIHQVFAPYIIHTINELCIKKVVVDVSPSSSSSSSSLSSERIVKDDRVPMMMEFEVDGDVVSMTSQVQQKKSYIMLIKYDPKTGEPIASVKGIASKKGDGVPFAVKLEKYALYKILLRPLDWKISETKMERALNVLNYIRDALKKLMLGDYSVKDFEVSVKLNKPVQKYEGTVADHVKVALKQLKRGKQVETNSKISFVYIMPYLDLLQTNEEFMESIKEKRFNITSSSTINFKTIVENRLPEAVDYVIENNIPLDISYYIRARIIPKMVKFFAPLIFNHESYLPNKTRLSIEELEDLKNQKKNIIKHQEKIAEDLILDGEINTYLNALEYLKTQTYNLMREIANSKTSWIKAFPSILHSQCKECGTFYTVNLSDVVAKITDLNSSSSSSSSFDKTTFIKSIFNTSIMSLCECCLNNPLLKNQLEVKIQNNKELYEEQRKICWKCIDMTKVSIRSSFAVGLPSSKSSIVDINTLTENEKKAKYYTCPEDCQSTKCPIYIEKEKINYDIKRNQMKLNFLDW